MTERPVAGAAPLSRAPSGLGFILRRLGAFAREFVACVGRGRLAASGVLVLLAAATEGIGLALLVPLAAALGGESGAPGGIEAAIGRAFALLGVAPSLTVLLAAFIGLVVSRAAIVAARDLALHRLNFDFAAALRRQTFLAVARADWPFLVRQKLPDLLETLTSRIERIGHGTHYCLRLPAVATLGAVQLAIAFALSPPLTTGVLAWGAVLLLLFRRRRATYYAKGMDAFEAHGATFAQASDFLHALKLVKSHGAHARHVAGFDAAMARQYAGERTLERDLVTVDLAIQVAAALTLGAFLYAAAALVPIGAAGLIVMVVIFSRLVPLITEFQAGWQVVGQMLPIFDNVVDLRARCGAAAEPAADDAEPIALAREMRLSGVGFSYDGRAGPAALAALDLIIPAGAMVAVVGPTGAGKTTFGDLLLGLIAPETGTILVDGTPLDAARRASWRRSVGYVPQDVFLFNDTIRANLLWARPEASEADIARALEAAAADGFVAALPDGLDTALGERAQRLSGGERQRLSLARALLRQPTLLVLDEATSALDAHAERAVQTAIAGLRGAMTIVVIAHRLSTVRGADRVVVLDRGRIAREGPWAELARERDGPLARLFAELGAEADPP